MRWSSVLFGFVFGSMMAVLSCVAVIFFVDPDTATIFEWGMLVCTAFLAFFGFCAASLLLVRRMFLGKDRSLERLGRSIRQGGFLAVFCLSLLFLSREGWLMWWTGGILFAFLFLLELFFLRKFRIRKSV